MPGKKGKGEKNMHYLTFHPSVSEVDSSIYEFGRTCPLMQIGVSV